VEPANRSLWIATTPETAYPQLDGDVDVDVAIAGGGITGIVTARLLEDAGLRVAVVEMRRIADGATGYTTAKLTVGHHLIYADLVKKHGAETARAYAASNRWAIERLEQLIAKLGVDCDWERASNYVYTESDSRVRELEDEVAAAREAGVTVTLTSETDLPFPVRAAVRVDDQAQFHPRKFIQGVAATIPGGGSHVFEQTRVAEIRDGALVTSSGTVRAKHIVVATQMPFLLRGFLFAKAHPEKSYAVAARLAAASSPRGMYISAEEPTRSIRSTPGPDGERVLVVGGEGHKPGRDDDTSRRYEALERFLKERFDAGEVGHRWSTHDYVPVDRLPYIGQIRGVFVATGFAKWGLTKGALAAGIISDAVLGRSNEWARFYDAGRLSGAGRLIAENGRVAAWLVGDRVRPRDGRGDLDGLAPGDGTIARIGARHVAVFRDDEGQLHAVSARCTHLGCFVGWNRADRTWECPCHGSRFAADGTLLQGPATKPLEPRDL
jgi:glycine/D-amino acid oxidase-like deaminating enzyme/nitrite reductase/ring-hydroxylating ferredoxin subunit